MLRALAGLSLKVRITAAVLAVVAPVMGAVAYGTLSGFHGELRGSIARSQEVLLAVVADDIDRKLEEAQHLLAANAGIFPPGALADVEAAQRFLDGRAALLHIFDNHIGLFTAEGIEITESPADPARRGRDYSYRPYITNTVATRRPYITDPYRSSQAHGHPAIMMAAPVLGADGEVVAILAGSIDLLRDNLFGRLLETPVGGGGRLTMTTGDRTVIMHPDRDRILTQVPPGADALYDRVVDGGFQGTGVGFDEAGEEQLVTYRRLRTKGWVLAASYPAAQAYAPLRRMRGAFALAAAAGAGSLLLLLVAILRHFTAPLTRLTRHVEELPRRRGPEREVPVEGDDEVATLARAFNAMVADLDAQQRELGETQELFSLFMEYTPVFTFMKRVAGGESRVLHVSANYSRMLGIAARDMEGKSMAELFPPELAASMTADDVRVVEQGAVIEVEESLAGRDYTTIKFPIRHAGGDLLAGFTLDVTERRRAEERLRESEARFRELADSLPQMVYETDREGAFRYVNRTGMECFGYAQEELVGRMGILDLLAPEDRERGRRNFEARFQGMHAQQEYTGVRRDGTRLPVIIQAAPVVKDGEPTGVRGILIDITDRKNLEVELLRVQKLESLGVLAGGIAHDFNNILTGILGNLSLAKSHLGAGDPLLPWLLETEKASLHARDLTQQLLTFARGGAPVRRTLALEPLVRGSATFAARGASARVELSFAEALRPVEADEVQLAQVVHNLVINACQAMPAGGTVAVSADNVTLGGGDPGPLPPGEYVRLRVADQGVGFPPEHAARIFDPYFTTKQKGSGLGLAVAYSVVRNHGGHIEAASVPGRGATFTVLLPAASGPVAEAAAPPPPLPAAGGGARVLVMDDEPLVREVVAAMLRRLGYEVELARGGDEAVEACRRARDGGRRFDAAILDLTIPGGMGGREAVRLLHEIDPGIRAVVSSGYSDDPVMAGFREFGFAAVVRKPFQLQELGDALAGVLHRPA